MREDPAIDGFGILELGSKKRLMMRKTTMEKVVHLWVIVVYGWNAKGVGRKIWRLEV